MSPTAVWIIAGGAFVIAVSVLAVAFGYRPAHPRPEPPTTLEDHSEQTRWLGAVHGDFDDHTDNSEAETLEC